MYSLYANNDDISYGIKKFILDTEDDLQNLPKGVRPGSSALVISTSKVYVLNHEGYWIEIISSGGGGTTVINKALNWEQLF